MLDKIIRFSLQNRLLILIATSMLVITGIVTMSKMDIDVFPDLTAPTVVVMADAHNMSPEETERLVTFPIETAVNGATKVRRVRSSSRQGYSFVWVEFEWGTDIYKARQVVNEKLVTLSEKLPENVIPVLAPQSSVMGEILFIGMQADSTSMMELRTLADWVVKPTILGTGGVSQVTIIGGDYKQYHMIAHPLKMAHYGVTMADLEEVGKTFSENSSGGIVRDFSHEFVIRGMGRSTDLEELQQTVIKQINGHPVFLRDVATLAIAPAQKMGYASHNATPAVLLSISKQPGINTLEVTKNIEENLTQLKASLPKDIHLNTHIFRQSDFIQGAVNNVGSSLIEGAIFVVIVLFAFLGSLRTTAISVLAIPISLLATIIVLYTLGININTMTLGGMTIAIGSLVDDAIIDVENVYKHLKRNYQKAPSERVPVLDVIFKGSSEIRSSILHATFIIIVSFIPLFFLSGLEGRMLHPLGVAYIVSLFMSLLTAMTVTPLLCSLLLTKDSYLKKKSNTGRFSQWLATQYANSLELALAHKRWVLGTTGGLFVLAILVYATMGHSFLPAFNEGQLTINALAQPGISLDESNKLGQLIEQELLSVPGVVSTSRRTGRGELDEHSQATFGSELDVTFKDLPHGQEAFMHEVREKLAGIPGIVSTVGQPLGHRIDHMVSGTRANIAIKIFGTDLSKMYRLGMHLQNAIKDIPGLVDLAVEQQIETPQLQIRANRQRLAHYGISMGEFHDFIRLAFSREKIADIYEGQRKFDLILRLNEAYTGSIEQIKTALIDGPNGTKIPLEEVAEIVSTGGPNSISRENVQRKLVVSANVAGRDVTSVVQDIQQQVSKQIKLPEGYRIVYGGQFESAKKASNILLLTSLGAIIVIFLLLYIEFKNISLAGIILLNLPLALIGGLFAVYISSAIISIPAIIGFITLFGIATRNGILLVSRYQSLHSDKVSLREIVISGSKDRLNPIIMTALTSGLALIPMIINSHKSGNEIQSPMAIVVLGGLITSTLLNMYVIPIVYHQFVKGKKS